MVKVFLSVFFISICFNSEAQVSGVILDHSTEAPIPFVNIWVSGKMNGTTSDKSGAFSLPSLSPSDTIVFSSAGYMSKRVAANEDIAKVLLEKNVIALRPIRLRDKNVKRKEIEIGKFKTADVSHYRGTSNRPFQIGRFFPYHDSLKNVPLLKSVKVFMSSFQAGAIANVRLYEAGEDGLPANEIYTGPILIRARKGLKMARLEIIDLGIEFPNSGLIVAVESMIIPENRYELKIAGSKDRHVSYSPAVGLLPVNEPHFIVEYMQGKWSSPKYRPFKKTVIADKTSRDRDESRFIVPAITITLSN